ncbi:hypothetical protein BWQ96_07058 [Gracilariopsis chorda]|uniref:Uncharacterized protein n=1 Tax=Gracilariopsis chorda TaxID=448386 RepID=A0A2V3IMF0_9FLOR|nr:hypothetical protein BWQ96_07058 [Gracilariopsis chorda]|eukprot:PXF43229.1 hypothetical protein BWQ96_07058 [Gracilariopsis chorda]
MPMAPQTRSQARAQTYDSRPTSSTTNLLPQNGDTVFQPSVVMSPSQNSLTETPSQHQELVEHSPDPVPQPLVFGSLLQRLLMQQATMKA